MHRILDILSRTKQYVNMSCENSEKHTATEDSKAFGGLNEVAPLIFELNVDCFEELFEWLPLADLRALRQTCKRLKQVVDYYIKTFYPLVLRKLKIRNYELEYLCRTNRTCFKLIDHIDFLTGLSAAQTESIKYFLGQLKWISIESSQIEGDFNEVFLKYCAHLKCLSISKVRSGNVIGGGNDWLLRQYATLDHIMLNTFSYLNLEMETIELRTFFLLNPNIRIFSTSFEFLWVNRKWILESDIKLDQLNIGGSCSEELPMRLIWSLLKQLGERQFYKRLHITALWINQDDLDQIGSLHALEQLNLKSVAIKITLPQLINLKELNVYAYEFFEDLEISASNLVNVEQVYIAFASINDTMPFVRRCANVKQIKINHLENGIYFKNGIIDLSALNTERKKLNGAHKITMYVSEKIYLANKWMSKTNFDLVELKRNQSCKQQNVFW